MDSRLTGLTLKTSLSALLDLVLPRVCVVCGRPLLPQEQHLCTECLSDLPETRYFTLGHNPMADRFNAKVQVDEYEPYAYAAALYHYRADAGYKKISQALKYRRDFGTGRWAARLLGARLAASPLYADVDLVVPVPLHWTRYWRRGYNQAAVIAREVARALEAPCDERLLRRCRRTQSQTRLHGEQKAANVSGAFALRDGALPQARHILLIDDVFTTGATLAACHHALRKAFCPGIRISVATLGVVGE
ncbi:MAG: double zinc ribbon domain-containing protein [Bacteroidales bacterium]|nr:double zinc ribbon domain-containing protein [Bacteroidales bacterium]